MPKVKKKKKTIDLKTNIKVFGVMDERRTSFEIYF